MYSDSAGLPAQLEPEALLNTVSQRPADRQELVRVPEASLGTKDTGKWDDDLNRKASTLRLSSYDQRSSRHWAYQKVKGSSTTLREQTCQGPSWPFFPVVM